jgi:hypothetical protein
MNMNQTANRVQQEDSGQFESFDLTVYLGPDAIPWISATSRVGAVHGIPRHTSSLPALPDLLDMVYDYTDDIQFAEFQPKPEISRVLGELIFGDQEVYQLFQATRGVAADRGRQVLFRILAAPHLAVMPWELLPDPAAGRNDRQPYLALAPDTHLVRQARGRTYAMRMNMLEAPLNLLLVLSSPVPENDREDWLSFDIFEVKRNLLLELAPLEQAGLLRIDVEDRPTIDNLRRRIGAQRRGYHLFHYVGHAFPEGLILEDRAGYRENLSGAKLVELLQLCPELRLAVFAGCETARSAADPSAVDTTTAVGGRALLSLADYCVQEACPAVIGMQAVLPFSTERVFTRFFYQALATGYTTAESLRLARGAIQADLRVGGDLLDWSVPALFVGSGEPGAIVPRITAEPKAKPRLRAELNLGLRQRNARFFGRDLPLRQAVDVMIGRTPERVLVVTGANGMGKTSLVDRALEEVGNTASHLLFVSFNHLGPDAEQGWKMFSPDQFPDPQKLCELKGDDALERLCRVTNELLRYSKIETRDRDERWKAGEWWERLVEDMVRQQFVLVIDDVGALDRLQRELLERLLMHVLTEYLKERQEAGATNQSLREELLAQLSTLQKASAKQRKRTLSAQWERIGVSANVLGDMGTLSDRLLSESAEVYKQCLEQQIGVLGRTKLGTASSAQKIKVLKADGFENLFPALGRLESIRSSLGSALGILADRRSPVRIVVISAAPLRDFFNLPDDMLFEMRLAPLTWAETWRWIRRNLPALVRFGEDYLSRLWGRFGARLELWEELERLVLKQPKRTVNLIGMAKRISASPQPRDTRLGEKTAQRGNRALRIAVVGPFLAGPSKIADAITQLASEHGIGGRAVFGTSEAGALATLINEKSPFAKDYSSTDTKILQWLDRVLARQPDIILLDYGSRSSIEEIKQVGVFRKVFQDIGRTSLLISAGGNLGRGAQQVTVPSAYPEVLSVGSLGDDGRLRDYAEWHPQLAKPDLFMTDNLAMTPLAIALKPDRLKLHTESSSWGSSFAALHVAATAVLVWSLLPNLSPDDIRELLVKAAQPIPKTEAALGLTMESAIELARRRLVEETLHEGPASLQTLSAITGLEGRVLSTILERMAENNRVVRLSTGRLERFQLLR